MIRKIDDFISAYTSQHEGTLKAFSLLTDESLSQEVAPGYRKLGRIAWHIVDSLNDMGNRCGLGIDNVDEASVPKTAAEIRETYERLSRQVLDAVKEQWDDAALEQEDDMYGEKWKRGVTLAILIRHEVLHMGQITVLMRQAGLAVPGLCGPSKEEWAAFGMEAMQ